MPFAASSPLPISNKDVVSFTFDNPAYQIDRPVLIDPDNPSIYISYRIAKSTVRRLIGGLRAAGLQPGDTVCIHSFNSLIFPLLVLAIIGAGGRSTGTNPSYTRHELNHAFRAARVRFVLAEADVMTEVVAALNDHGLDSRERLFVLDMQPGHGVPSGYRSWKWLLSHGEQDWIRFDDSESSLRICQMFLTSGTTGLPKCSLTSHRNLVAQHQMFFQPNPRSYSYRKAMCMPFFHAGIFPQIVVTAMKDGWEAYVMRRFEMEPFLRYHTMYNLTELFIAPPAVLRIVMSGLADPTSDHYRPEYSLRSVRNGVTGAASCSADIQRRFNTLLGPGATFTQVWGMTETTGFAAMVPWELARRTSGGELDTWGAVGRLIPNLEAKLIDSEGNDVTARRRGELCVRGPTIIKAYAESGDATRDSWDQDGFYKTGDIIRFDQHNLMHVEERVKELIKVRGFQVAPAELEGVLITHPSIVDVAVVGVTRHDNEELPRAYIVRRTPSGDRLTEKEVHDHMKGRLARYKQLTGGIKFVSSIPKLPSGKILKRVLKEQARKELAEEPRLKL